ncbi:MAG: UvrD-helicase domain-containing protein [Bdellovibrionales bacterium]|nr:UvrD-helicase domain-containing protein [Bdellovibrionales bacterium]
MILASDEAIRQQIISDTCNQVIVASAGSGKTTLMVKKYIHLIQEGVAPEKIAAITFTNKSAQELTKRIYEEYQNTCSHLGPLPIHTLPICTIHSFCKSIITPYAPLFGFVPNFDVDQDHRYKHIQALYTQALPRLAQQNKNQALWSLIGLVPFRKIYDWLLTCESIEFESDLPNIALSISDIISKKDIISDVLTNTNAKEDDALYLLCEHWHKIINSLQQEQTQSWFILLQEKIPNVDRKGNQKNWGSKETLQNIRENLKDFFSTIELFKEYISSLIISELNNTHQELQSLYLQFKKENQFMEPDDLLLFTKKLLYSEKIWKNISSQYQYILIDEFQDTDPIQAEIIFRILSKKFPHGRSWFDIEIRPHCLTVVGDPQQSIYRFRHASVETFYKTQEKIMEAGGKSYTINQNFRSSQKVIEFVNQQFSSMHSFTPLIKRPDSIQGSVDILTNAEIGESESLHALRKTESEMIVRFLKNLLENNHDCSPSDIAILLPTFNHVDLYEKDLREHFSISKERRSTKLHPFMLSLCTVFRFLNNPEDQNNTLALLRTPFFFHTLTDIANFYLEKEKGILDQIDHETSKLIYACIDWYRKSPYIFIDRFSQILHLPKSSIEYQLVTWTKNMIFEFENYETRENNLLIFLEEKFKTDFIPEDRAKKSIRMMTIHQSKGLEFPIVILAGLYTEAVQGSSLYVNPSSGLAQFGLSPFVDWLHTKDFETTKQKEDQAFEFEKRRLLYVAATRAQKQLITTRLPVSHKRKTFADLLWS